MDFHEFRPMYEAYRRAYGHVAPTTPSEFYAAHGDSRSAWPADWNSCIFQSLWYKCGKPYYRVYPNVIDMLTRVKIDIPCDALQLPFEVLTIHLPKTDHRLISSCGNRFRAVLVGCGTDKNTGERGLFFQSDDGRDWDNGQPRTWVESTVLRSDWSIEEAILAGGEHPTEGHIPLGSDQRAAISRLIVSVCFLATGSDRLIEPDVLSKDFAKYIEAHRQEAAQAIDAIVQRAHRRGKIGYTVGRSESMRTVFNTSSNETDGTGHELSHSHQRSAHFRQLPSGRVVLVRQCTVRPDLPAATHGPQYVLR